MRLPSLSLATGRPSFDWLEGIGGRRLLLYIAYTLVLFTVFLVVNFPHQVFVERALSEIDQAPLRIGVRDTRFAWWNGWELRAVEVREVGRPLPLLESPSLFVRPSLGELTSGKLASVNVSGTAYGGTIEGTWSNARGLTRATIRFDRLMLGRYEPITTLLEEGMLTGALSGAVTFENRRGDNRAGRAAGDLELKDGSVTEAKVQGFGIPNLHFGSVTAKFNLQGRTLEIEEVNADGEELSVVASGQVALRDPLADSAINLRVKALPGPNSPDAIRGLLSLIPKPAKGRPDAPFTVTGTLSKPRLR